MHVEEWPLGKIKPYPNNPRVLRNAAEKVAESIKAFGWRQPIVVDEHGVIIIGHGRLEAAKLLKLKKAPVHVATGLTEDQVRALRVADNKTGEFSAWDDGKLHDELQAIMASVGSIEVTGFTRSDLDKLEMQTKAALANLRIPTAAAAIEQPAPEPSGDPEPAPITGTPTEAQPASVDSGADTLPVVSGEQAPAMVPFQVLMDQDARQVVYDAAAKAKQKHGLETTADALLVICRGYLTNA